MNLPQFFSAHPQVAIAFSGGVDSAYLLYAAKQYAEKVQAYYVKTPFQPQFEWEDACRLARELQVPMTTLPVDILACSQVAENPPDRCYHCKRQIMSHILTAANADGFSLLLDGTNASDQAADRPGMTALRELSVCSPLQLCGLTKEEIRRLSRDAGLFTWNKPAYACLATRIPTGQSLTAALLQRTEWAEDFLARLGFADFRVRTWENCARIQVREDQLPLLLTHRQSIVSRLKEQYQEVFLDLEVRK